MHNFGQNSLTFVQILCRKMRAHNVFFLFFSIILCCSCRQGGYVSFSGYAQGGTYTVKYNSDGVDLKPEAVRKAVDALLEEIDFSLSGNRNSILSRRNAGEEIEPDRHFSSVLETAEEYRQMSGGAFDCAAAPLFDAWGFGFTSDSLPSPERLAAAMEDCRMRKKLNFNAIAQGYTCDAVAEYLHSIGVKDMMVDIGEIYCEGLNPRGEGWTIGIDTPTDGNNTPGAELSGIWKSDGGSYGVVTSGNYRKFYIKDGRKYAHTLDPRSGMPVQHNLLSATVIAPTATDADALATIFMVIGFEEAKEYVLSHEDVEACLITSEGIWESPEFKH